MTRFAFRGQVLTPRSPTAIHYEKDGVVVVGDDGRIAEVAPASSSSFAGAAIDLGSCLIVPGFVDAHVHYPQTRIVGSATGPLLEWLERSVFPEEARFRDAAYAREVAREFVQRLATHGTTTAGIFSTSDAGATGILFEELAASGLRAVAGLTLMDQNGPADLCVPEARALAACEELAARWHGHDGGRLGFAVTPRFALSCSRSLMEAAGRFADRGKLVVQTHVSENDGEGRATLAAHPWAHDYVDVYEKTGLLGPRTVLAHAIHVTTSEWDRIAARGARVAHCPDSNFFLGSGRMRLVDARRRGVVVGLGSDIAAGRTFSIQRAAAHAYDNALAADTPPPSPGELFAMATLGGAAALGLDAVTGSLERGKDADIVVLEVPSYVRDEATALGHLVFASDLTTVRRVLVRGRSVELSPSLQRS